MQITNNEQAGQNLLDWVLWDKADNGPRFTFPDHVLEPQDTIRVYTNEVHAEWGGFSFGSGKAIWNNSGADLAELLDASGDHVDDKSYEVDSPPGCMG